MMRKSFHWHLLYKSFVCGASGNLSQGRKGFFGSTFNVYYFGSRPQGPPNIMVCYVCDWCSKEVKGTRRTVMCYYSHVFFRTIHNHSHLKRVSSAFYSQWLWDYISGLPLSLSLLVLCVKASIFSKESIDLNEFDYSPNKLVGKLRKKQ